MTETELPEDATSRKAGSFLHEGDRREWRRHPGDVARLVGWLGLLVIALIASALIPDALRGASADVVRLFARLPDPLRYALVGLAQLAIVLLPPVVIGWLLLRRRRAEAALVAGAGVAAALVMAGITDWLDRVVPPELIDDLPSTSFASAGFPSTAYLAALVAGSTVVSPLLDRGWRSIAWGAVALTVVVRILTAVQAPVNVAMTITLGGAIGTTVLVAFGSPLRRPGAATLREVLARSGFHVEGLRDEERHTGRRTYAGTAGGRAVDVVYADRDDRDADLLARSVRAVFLHSVDEDNLSVQPERRVAHRGLVTAMSRRAGVRTPDVLALAPTERDGAVIALESPPGEALDDLAADEISAAALVDAWTQLDRLHAARIAHRSLTRRHVVLDGDEAWLVDLEVGRLTASDDQLAVDAAELLVSTALVVGAERALDAATATTRPSLERALAFVQPAALPDPTSRVAKKSADLLEELRVGLQERLDLDPVELERLDRISIARVVSWIGFAVLAFFLLTLATSWSEISEAMRGVDWPWIIPVFLATIAGTIGGAMSLSGSVVRPVPLGEASVVMFGQSFLNRFTPMNAGGMAMRIRYLQKGGTDGTVATAAIGLTSAASGVMQVGFIAFFFLWSSSDPTAGLSLRSENGDDGGVIGTVISVFVLAVVVAGVLIAFTPRLRRWVLGFLRSTRDKIRRDFGELARRPSKMMLLFGGAAVSKLSTIVAFAAACRAFDVDLAFAELGALYLGANTVASAVPTPGGVGAIEAALVLVLTNAGVEDAAAWAAVLLFRLINYWFPTIPGYVALKISERRELV